MNNDCSGGPCLLFPRSTKTLLFDCSAVTSALACVGSWNTSHGNESASFGSFLNSIATRRRFRVVQRVSKSLMTRIAKKKRKMLRTTGRLKGPHLTQNTLDNSSNNTVRSPSRCANNCNKVPLPDQRMRPATNFGVSCNRNELLNSRN